MSKKFPSSFYVFSHKLKQLSDLNRLKILFLLKEKEKMCVCEIFQNLCLPQNLISYHLKILKELGFIEDSREGKNVYYSLKKKNLDNFWQKFNNLF